MEYTQVSPYNFVRSTTDVALERRKRRHARAEQLRQQERQERMQSALATNALQLAYI